MDADEEHELERLRARAYGPRADIADDPVALARLNELEDRERSRPAPVIAVTVDPAPVSDDDPAEGDRSEGDEQDLADNPRPLLRSRRRVWIAALAIAGVVASTSAATAAGVSFTAVDRTAGIAQTDALTPDPGLDLGSAGYLGFDPAKVRGFADYYGLTVFAGPTQIDAEGNEADCLVVNDTAAVRDSGSARTAGGSVRLGSCGAGPFPAAVEFIVSAAFPEAFRTRYPVGTAVQFVLDGEDVGVFTTAG